MQPYSFDQAWARERRRLDALGALYDGGTIERLRVAGVRAGACCLEVGAGTGAIARWLAAEVGAAGRVVATDLDTRFLDELAGVGVEVWRHDIGREPLPPATFDVIHVRAVLEHVPARAQALATMASSLRPGGRLLVEEIVMPHPASQPPLPSWGLFLGAIERRLRSAGAEPNLGLQLPAALAAAGLADVTYEARAPLMHTGTPSIDFVVLTFEQLGPRLVEAGLLTAAELEVGLAALRAPGHTMTAALLVAASGRKEVPGA